ncbi:MAG: NAD(P)-binding protein, partial [Kineosporiaceae bacterium]
MPWEATVRDLTPPPPLGQGRFRSGPVRGQRPVYLDQPAPCGAACPAGEDVQGWLAFARGGDEEAAWRRLTSAKPLPAVHGRVCYHPCETACNRSFLDAAVSVHGVERHLGDLAIERGWAFEPSAASSGRRVLVVGSGPSGLS